MKKILSYCKGLIKSIFTGFVFLFVKLLSIVNKKPQTTKGYINLNKKPDDGDEPPPPTPII